MVSAPILNTTRIAFATPQKLEYFTGSHNNVVLQFDATLV